MAQHGQSRFDGNPSPVRSRPRRTASDHADPNVRSFGYCLSGFSWSTQARSPTGGVLGHYRATVVMGGQVGIALINAVDQVHSHMDGPRQYP